MAWRANSVLTHGNILNLTYECVYRAYEFKWRGRLWGEFKTVFGVSGTLLYFLESFIPYEFTVLPSLKWLGRASFRLPLTNPPRQALRACAHFSRPCIHPFNDRIKIRQIKLARLALHENCFSWDCTRLYILTYYYANWYGTVYKIYKLIFLGFFFKLYILCAFVLRCAEKICNSFVLGLAKTNFLLQGVNSLPYNIPYRILALSGRALCTICGVIILNVIR